MHDPVSNVERGYGALRTWFRQDAALEAEFQASAPEFFGIRPAGQDSEAALSERRHLEWFALERESAHLGGVPIQVLSAHPEAAERGLGAAEAASWIGSFTGVFEVTGVRPAEGLWVRDLAGSGEYPLAEPEVAQVLEAGDLIAGRIFPVGDTLFGASPAAVFLRDSRLLEALRADIDRARERTRGVLRIAQRDIEALFHRPRAAANAGDPTGELRALLARGGLAHEEIEVLLEELASAPFDPDALAPGAGDVLGEILDQLAFETELDLEEARRAMLVAWQHLARRGPGSGASLTPKPASTTPSQPQQRSAPAQRREPAARAAPPRRDPVAEALAEFDRARASGSPLDQSFDALERALELDREVDPDEAAPAPDFPGAIAALVEEFLWELERTEGAASARACACLRSLGRYAEPIGVSENLDTRALADFAARWSLDQDELHGAEEARTLVAALERFRRWSEESQALTLDASSGELLRLLARELPRLAEANQRRTRRADVAEGEVFELVGLERDNALVRGDSGEQRVAIDPMLVEWLRVGDRLRGRAANGRLAVYACYPHLEIELAPDLPVEVEFEGDLQAERADERDD